MTDSDARMTLTRHAQSQNSDTLHIAPPCQRLILRAHSCQLESHRIQLDMSTTPHPANSAQQSAIERLRLIGLKTLPSLMTGVLEQADDALFNFAQSTGTSAEQQPFLDAMREVRRERSRIEQTFLTQLEATFCRAADELGTEASPSEGLRLLDEDALEVQLACGQLTAAAEKPHMDMLRRVHSRLSGGGSADDPPSSGCQWAKQITAAFQTAIDPIDVSIRARLVLYKLFERQFQAAFGTLLVEFDRYLHHAGFNAAPNTRASRPMPAPSRAPGTAADTTAPSSDSAGPTGHGAGYAGGPSDSSYGAAYAGTYGRGGGGGGGGGNRQFDSEEELFAVMREALALHSQRNRPNPAAAASSIIRTTLSQTSALSVLSRLQANPPASILNSLDDPHATLAQVLTGELIRHAKHLGITQGQAELELADAQALALVGMLFDVLLSHRSYLPDVRRQFLRLSVPYAKAAMLDPRMFALKGHPARRLLDALAEASDGNQGESSAECDMLARIDTVVNRLLTDFNEDIAIFAEIETEFRESLLQHGRRALLSEQRATEAQRGSERLDHARECASTELNALLMANRLPEGKVGVFLRDNWTHHLSMVALRDGTESDRYRSAQRLGRAIWLIVLLGHRGQEAKLDSLRPGLIDVLNTCGQQGDVALATIEGLLADLRTLSPPAKAAPAAPKPPEAAAVAKPVTPTQAPPSAQDAAQVRALAVGDWVEFIEADGTTVPAKLSWVSPISSRLLFVNRRGMRHCVMSHDELAALAATGRMEIRSGDSTFTHAMVQVLDRLRQPEADSASLEIETKSGAAKAAPAPAVPITPPPTMAVRQATANHARAEPARAEVPDVRRVAPVVNLRPGG